MTKTVLITGASGKLGAAIARYLAPLGWELVLTSREITRLAILGEELCALGAKAHFVELDLLNESSSETLALRVADMGIKISHVVSNARSLEALKLDQSGFAPVKPFMDELMIDVVAPYRMLMGLVSDPRHELRGVVTVGSQYGEIAPNPTLYDGDLSQSPIQYGVSKAALHHITRELSVRLAPRVRVNCVAYGGFVGRADPDFMDRYAKLLPLGRMLKDTDAGGPVAFLLDDIASAAVTGHILVVDGGWSVW